MVPPPRASLLRSPPAPARAGAEGLLLDVTFLDGNLVIGRLVSDIP